MAKCRARGEGSLRKRSDGRWEGRDVETGKLLYRNVLARTQAECKAKLREAIRNVQQAEPAPQPAGPQKEEASAPSFTVDEWLRTWFDLYSKPNLRETTQEQYTSFLEKHLIPNIGDIPLEKLTSLRLQKLYQDPRSCTNRLKPFHQGTKSSNKPNRLSRTDRDFVIFGKAAGIIEPG